MNFKIENKLELLEALEKFKENRITSILVFCSAFSIDAFKQDFFPLLKSSSIPFLGGVYPSIIYDSAPFKSGVLVIGLNKEIHYTRLSLDLPASTLGQKITEFKHQEQGFCAKSLLLFVSAFGTDKSVFLSCIFDNFGNQVNYFGSGCGDLSFNDIECIITPEGVFKNSGLMVSFKSKAEINFSYGWKAYSESYKVTQVDKNEVITINWRPAFEVYKEALSKLANETITAENFNNLVKSYPFGILRMDSDLIIRDPYLLTERGGIMIVDKIEEGEFIRIMHGDSNGLIEASNELSETYTTTEDSTIFCIACISRKLFHGAEITRELKSISATNLVGAFTIGEVANEGKSFLEMFNKIIATIKI